MVARPISDRVLAWGASRPEPKRAHGTPFQGWKPPENCLGPMCTPSVPIAGGRAGTHLRIALDPCARQACPYWRGVPRAWSCFCVRLLVRALVLQKISPPQPPYQPPAGLIYVYIYTLAQTCHYPVTAMWLLFHLLVIKKSCTVVRRTYLLSSDKEC